MGTFLQPPRDFQTAFFSLVFYCVKVFVSFVFGFTADCFVLLLLSFFFLYTLLGMRLTKL